MLRVLRHMEVRTIFCFSVCLFRTIFGLFDGWFVASFNKSKFFYSLNSMFISRIHYYVRLLILPTQ